MKYLEPFITQRADPQIYKHTDGTYYFTGSFPEYDRIVLRSATTIEALQKAQEHVIWTRHPEGEMSQFIWAPEIHYINNQFIIYFAAKSSDKLDHTVEPHRIYILRLNGDNPMTDPWSEEGVMETGWKSFSLDATTFNYQGNDYFVWAQMRNSEEGNSNIYIAKMKNYKELELPATCLSIPEYNWECQTYKVNEGPAIAFYNGKIHLTYSASATDHTYCIGLLTMNIGDDPLKMMSWKKRSKPIFVTDPKRSIYGPGHNSFTYSEDGQELLMVFHARDYKEIEGDPLYDHNRHARIIPYQDLLEVK